MVDPTDRLLQIRDELAGDLSAVEGKLDEARATTTAAETAHRAAVAEWKALEQLAVQGNQTIVRGGDVATYTSLASPLHARLMDVRDALIKPAERVRGQARAQVIALEHRRGTLLDALEQIEWALRGERNRAVVILPSVPKRVAPIIEYSNVDVAS